MAPPITYAITLMVDEYSHISIAASRALEAWPASRLAMKRLVNGVLETIAGMRRVAQRSSPSWEERRSLDRQIWWSSAKTGYHIGRTSVGGPSSSDPDSPLLPCAITFQGG